MSGISNVGGAQPINMISLEGLDLESMIMAVQTNRVNVLDEQIKSKMEVVQARNVRINELNANMSGMNAAIASIGGTAATDELKDTNLTNFQASAPRGPVDTAAIAAKETQIANLPATIASNQATANTTKAALAAADAKLNGISIWANPSGYTAAIIAASAEKAVANAENETANANLAQSQANVTTYASELAELQKGPIDPEAAKVKTRAQAEAYVKSLQTQIDSLGNTQQMDMLNLQSLSNKRNEAFEIMTNFMKKFNDSRAGIIQKF